MVVAVYLESEVPVFTPTEEQVARFRARLRDPSAPGPSDRWEVLHCRSEREFLDALPRAAAVAVWRFRQEWFTLAPRLRAVCTPAAGRDYFRVVPPPGVEMRYGGFHGAIMGETAAACVLALSHGVLRHAGDMRTPPNGSGAAWPRPALAACARRLAGATVLVLGFGRIGRAAGRFLKPFGPRIVGVSRSPHPAPDWFGPGDRVETADRLDGLLPLADHLLCFLPSGPETDRLLDARRLALLRPTAFLCNFGRGNLVDEDALCAALRAGRLAGAVLDVFREEPLPADSPLRAAPNLWLLPHASAFSPDYVDLYFEELAPFLASL